LLTKTNGDDGNRGRKMSKSLSPHEFATKFAEFVYELKEAQSKKGLEEIDDQEQIVELFRLWLMDTRDQEMLAEAREEEQARRDRGFE
jgi:hypothetical protein